MQLAVTGVDLVALLAHPLPLVRTSGSPKSSGQL